MTAAITNSPLLSHFSRAATTYDAAAGVQCYVAAQLGRSLRDLVPNLPAAPILEIGCGTGLMTRQLLREVGMRELLITDISEAMLDRCRKNVAGELTPASRVRFELLDANYISESNRFSAVVCSFSLQWFNQLQNALRRMLDSLVDGGYLLLSVPTDNSFPEWKEACRATGASFSGNLLPGAQLLPQEAQHWQLPHSFKLEQVQSFHSSALDFFQGLRKVGADLQIEDEGTSANLLAVVRAWNRSSPGGVVSTYEICHGWVQARKNEAQHELP